MTGILLDAVYASGLLLASPVWLYRMIRHGRYRSGWGERFGAAPVRYGLQPVIWIHGVSLGEINAARTLVVELHSQLPDYRVAVSSTTDTGMAAAKKLFAPDHLVFHWPLDFTWAVRRALRRLAPELVVLMEGEVWPNFLSACDRRGVPVVIVNGRLSPRGLRWRLAGPLAGKVFNRLAAVGVQHQRYAERFAELGLDPAKVQVTGMLKYDTAEPADESTGPHTTGLPGQDALARALGIAGQDRLVVAGGTGPGEEKMILDVYAELKSRHRSARLAIVPRKPERFEEVARLIIAGGLPLVRKSQCPDGAEAEATADAVILGDTMGELRKFYAMATCIFVGRSLVPMGGSDMIEAAALGKPTAFGPHTFNFPQADDLARHGCVRVADARSLGEQLDRWLADPAAAARAGQAAQQYVRSQQGATRRNVEMICEVLGRVPAAAPGAIATEAIKEP
ncbi:MAG TPA: 3-deoxy-D-manno-octulosonic acid transferase [Phycisphaerae bacterium]|nr:3-deoxy-D-manno-octulosonic acid transferase [Phycisphaerae bacterium]